MFFGTEPGTKKSLRGKSKIASDSLIFGLAVLRNLLGFDTESYFLWELKLMGGHILAGLRKCNT
ncbi:MAG: hypothetical protein IEMM0008_1469 [bacterium]|nr:MAG: hypothetical protein IEMM0008_1469 [bacterium]